MHVFSGEPWRPREYAPGEGMDFGLKVLLGLALASFGICVWASGFWFVASLFSFYTQAEWFKSITQWSLIVAILFAGVAILANFVVPKGRHVY